MACEIGGMTSDSTKLNTEAPHKTPASTRRVAFLLCLVFLNSLSSMSPPQETAILLFHYQTYLRNL